MVNLELPGADGDQRLAIAAKTVYCSLMGSEGVKVGMVFTGLDAEVERAIQRFLE